MLINWFQENPGPVFFVYGLTYVIIAVSVLARDKKESGFSLAGILWLFAGYALVHAPADFIDMWLALTAAVSPELKIASSVITYFSYVLLFEFGRRLMRLKYPGTPVLGPWLLPLAEAGVFIMALLTDDFRSGFDIFTGYLVRFPAGVMAGAGIILYYRGLPAAMKNSVMKRYFYAFGAALFSWALICGLVRVRGEFFPSNIINIGSFLQLVNIPVYVFRSLCGLAAAWAIIGILNIFTRETQERLMSALDGERRAGGFLSRVISSISDPLVVTDRQGRITLLNRALEEILSMKEADMTGTHVSSIMSPSDWKLHVEPVLESKIPFEGEINFIRRGGEAVPVVYSVTQIISDNGIRQGWLGMARDISVRKKIEEVLSGLNGSLRTGSLPYGETSAGQGLFMSENVKRNEAEMALLDSYAFLQTIIDSVDDEVVVRGYDNRVLIMNKQAMKKKSAQERQGSCCRNVVEGIDYPCDQCGTGSLVSAVAEKGGPLFFERRCSGKGVIKVWEVSASPLFEADGTLIGIVEVSRDVTARRELERDVLNIYETERQRIGQDLHDDLMQNLIGIDVLLKMVSGSLNEKNAESSGFSDESARIKEITGFLENTVSKSRRIARGLCPIDLNPDGFSAALEQMVHEIQGLYRLECGLTIPDLLPEMDELTMRHLYYIIREALSNAAKHSGASEAVISLETDGSALYIDVTDNGTGCDNTGSCSGGLGMRIMKYRADLIGAAFRVDSSPTGTRVRCSLNQNCDQEKNDD